MSLLENLKRTPLYEAHLAAGGKMVEFGGWEMPIQYKGIKEEHDAVRNHVGIFDVSHMGEVEVKGQEAGKFVNYLITNDTNRIKDGDIQYAVMCYETGGVVDDLLVYKKGENDFLLIINASNVSKDLEWMDKVLSDSGFDAQLKNISNETAEVALQGPLAEKLLQEHVAVDLSKMTFFQFKEKVEVAGVECLISRSGYTGEDGFEIYTNNVKVEKLWTNLLESGTKYNIQPCGLGARDTLRFEANLPLYGHEMSEHISPLEAGYAFCVRLDKENFIGKEALVAQKTKGLEKKVVGFEMTGKGIARAEYPVFDASGHEVGHVTTGYKSPTLEKSIGLAIVENHLSEIGQEIWIQIRKNRISANVISRKFLDKNYKH
ncbi:MAG: glycine cleavage system aminomethyltransferase GcvT [Tissierellales bacterium]|nr:glycine cleavage system aminomethyltransferase GcvT [Tissierellales bacterium]MBN2826388.1 glycine cleavage system aminomethyltransferase GcvT [Tissierellales bacterium]